MRQAEQCLVWSVMSYSSYPSYLSECLPKKSLGEFSSPRLRLYEYLPVLPDVFCDSA